MSDIFISYSKADHALALKLSAFLEAEGWSVWWDKSLGAADLYRDEIMKQLAAARAVITIWTENSVKSDWVRAEAGRAKAEAKLIPVKTTGVAYADIPLPFGEMHTENVGSTDLIRAAIVAQLAKPTVPQSPVWQITSTFKYQVLTWIGIIGSSITLFANLNSVLDMADWARELVDHWHDWAQVFCEWAFSLFGFKVPKEVTPVISFAVFATMLVVGVNLSYRRATNKSATARPDHSGSYPECLK
jgi:TIR domain